MNLKDTRIQWLACLLLALGLGIAIYQATSRPSDELEASAPSPIAQELQDNAANGVVPPPASAAMTPLEHLLNNRRRRTAAGQTIPNAPIDFNEPAQAAGEMPSGPVAPGPPSPLDGAMRPTAQSLETEKAPPGIPITAKNLGGGSEALRNNSPPAAATP